MFDQNKFLEPGWRTIMKRLLRLPAALLRQAGRMPTPVVGILTFIVRILVQQQFYSANWTQISQVNSDLLNSSASIREIREQKIPRVFNIKCILLSINFLLPILLLSQADSIMGGVYAWKEPKHTSPVILFEGSTYDMKWLRMTANSITPSKTKLPITVPNDQEQLLIVRTGTLSIGRDSVFSLGPGSVALFMPGENYLLQNAAQAGCTYYLMTYQAKNSTDKERLVTAGGAHIRDWNKLEFKPHDKGGRRDFFEIPTAMCKRFEMHVTTLKQGLKSHDPHTHRAAEIIVVIDGSTEMLIGDKMYKGEKGSVYYLPSNVLHGIRNNGAEDCSYFAFQFE